MTQRSEVGAAEGVMRLPLAGVDMVVGVVVWLVMLGCVVLALVQFVPPQVVGADAAPTVFSSGRAMQHVLSIAQRPHAMGMADHDRVRDYIVGVLQGMGLQPEVQRTTGVSPRVRVPFSAGMVENVVVRLPGREHSRVLMLAAHYDSVLTGPGANDDGVGVAAMLEAARAIRAGLPLERDVILLFTDGEEAGLLGANAFVAEHPWAKDVAVVVNLEARGSSGPVLMFETSANNGRLIEALARETLAPFGSSLFYEVYTYLPNDTDFTVFKRQGMAGMNFAFIDSFIHYHAALDDVAHVNERGLQHQGEMILALMRVFARDDMGDVGAPNQVFFNVLGSWMVYYPTSFALPVLVLVVMVFVGVVVLGVRRGRLSLGGVLLGFLAFLGCVILAGVVVFGVVLAVVTLHPQYQLFVQRDTYNSHVYIAAYVAITVMVVALFYQMVCRRVRVANLAFGALVWWLLFAGGTSVAVPGGSYLFVWPLLCVLVAWLVVWAPREQEYVLIRHAVVLLFGVLPGVVLFAPFVYLLFVALSVGLAPVLVISVVMVLGLLVPQLALIASPRAWVLPGVAGVVGAGLLIVGSLTSGFDSAHRRPTDVLYGLDADRGQALWASSGPAPDAWTAQFFDGGFEQGGLEAFFPTTQQVFLRAPAPQVPLAAPVATLVESSVRGDLRMVRFHVASMRQAPMAMVYVDPKVEVVHAEVAGYRIGSESGPPITPWGMVYWALPREGVDVTLTVKATEVVRVRVVDRTDGLPDIPGRGLMSMPDSYMPTPALGIAGFSNATLVSASFTFPPDGVSR